MFSSGVISVYREYSLKQIRSNRGFDIYERAVRMMLVDIIG